MFPYCNLRDKTCSSVGSQEVSRIPGDTSVAASDRALHVSVCLEPAYFLEHSEHRLPCTRNKQAIADCCMRDPTFQSLVVLLGEEELDLVWLSLQCGLWLLKKGA